MIQTYGEPGGIYFSYTLDLDRGQYLVHNEEGVELFASQSEASAVALCEELIARG